jgi:thiol-disulfide isomerase/thioredoxin
MNRSILVCLICAIVTAIGTYPVSVLAEEDLTAANLGKRISNVTFHDSGKTASLQDFKRKKAVVVVVLNFDCPNSTGYAPTLAELAKSYGDKGVAFLGVCPCDDEETATVAKKAAEYKLGFPVYKDDKRAAVDALRVTTTPEVFVLDHDLVLRYRGRIDDAYSARLKKNSKITSHDLKNALDELLAGKTVSTPVTKAVGCPIPTDQVAKSDGHVTYYRDVQPILQENCQACHRPGEVGPFSLTTYKQAVQWSTDIKRYTQSRVMPPWKITEGIPFHNERRLSDKDLATLAAWVDDGTPAGKPKDAPKSKEFVEGWRLGKPDLVLEPQADFVLGPSGADLFHCYALPTNQSTDKYVVAIEVKPGNRRVVHHTLNFIDTTGQARKLEEKERQKDKDKTESDFDQGPGYTVAMGIGFLPRAGMGGWAPGQLAHQLPEGYGWLLPKGADVVLQVHYHRNGRVEKDRTQIGLYFARKTEGMKPYKGGVIRGQFFAIPAGNDHFLVKGSLSVIQDCELHTIMPHMHLLGKEIKVTLKPGDGGPKQKLLTIKDWDYNWQETYFLQTPMKLKAGDTLEVEAVYNNSDKNPNNPNRPPRAVTFGEQTTNEMCFVFLGATSDGPGRSPFRRADLPRRQTAEKKTESKSAGGKSP